MHSARHKEVQAIKDVFARINNIIVREFSLKGYECFDILWKHLSLLPWKLVSPLSLKTSSYLDPEVASQHLHEAHKPHLCRQCVLLWVKTCAAGFRTKERPLNSTELLWCHKSQQKARGSLCDTVYVYGCTFVLNDPLQVNLVKNLHLPWVCSYE